MVVVRAFPIRRNRLQITLRGFSRSTGSYIYFYSTANNKGAFPFERFLQSILLRIKTFNMLEQKAYARYFKKTLK